MCKLNILKALGVMVSTYTDTYLLNIPDINVEYYVDLNGFYIKLIIYFLINA